MEHEFRIWRGDAEGGKYSTYSIKLEEGMVVLDALHRIQKEKSPELGVRWNYYDIRDTRTLFDLGVDPKMPKADKHHALHDAFRQVIGVQNVMRELANCGVPVNQTTY